LVGLKGRPVPLDPSALLTLAQACAPAVAPSTMLAIATVESGLDPLAIGVNGPAPHRLAFSQPDEAAQAARELIAQGRDVDLGLAQINVRNLAALGLSIEQALKPCPNLAASAEVLQAGYERAAPRTGDEQVALRTALSYYNTGRPDRGFTNGYVAKVTAAARQVVPAIVDAASAASDPHAQPPPSAAWDVFGRPRLRPQGGFVLTPQSGSQP
jgi:type IV secretion system protein VirB1